MNYSDDLDKVVCGALDELIEDYKNGLQMFTNDMNYKYYEVYKTLMEEQKK